ncbi:FmdB family zinc ribbon protein [Microbacterium sp. BK668]|uniref:FmdB family zinc ribbon protein n=1 Tax=Microbacterium sp. BK668 TaxID=2512118 RepID=UPI00105C61C1|nr:FmdB family zinc ribbon protein [Microbacterium sp. BK668]TDN92254.1 putative FmdB family regulatory protein [Microbacterium sp. BK668]
MPTYAYACKQCGHRFDAVQSFADPALTECPECGGALRKEYGSIGVTFNGSGFYRTDSRPTAKESSGSSSGSDSSSGASSSGSSSSGSSSSGSSSGGSSSSGSSGGGSSPTSTGSKSEAKASPAAAG